MSTEAIGALAGLLTAVAVLVWVADARHRVGTLVLVAAATATALRLVQLWAISSR